MSSLLVRAACLVLLAAAFLFAADDPAGRYTGTWNSDKSSSGGNIVFVIKPASMTDSSVTFTLSGTEFKAKIITLRLEGQNLDLQYEFDIQGSRLTSTIKGTLTGGKLEGKYKTTATNDAEVDSGTLKATQN